jgi:hypothetical protein
MRIFRIVLLVVGVAALVVAAVWRPVVAPTLTKLPVSLDETLYFTGTYTGYVNQATGVALAAPQQAPLHITRHIKAVPAESTSSVLVVNDASAITIGRATSMAVLQYALDRSTEQSVTSPDAFALAPSNVVDRVGSYSLGPPQGADPAKSYPLWTDEIGRAVPLISERGISSLDGVSVQRWEYTLTATPMVARMVRAMNLPAAMSFASFEAELKAKGLDLAAAFQALAPSLTTAQRASLVAATAAPIPLECLYATHAQVLVQPTTGAVTDILSDVRSYSGRPDLSPLAAILVPILAAHQSNPAAARLIAATRQLASAPAQPLYTLTFHQTPASAASTAATAAHDGTLLQVVRLWIPIALVVIGLALVALGLIGRRRKRSRTETGAPAASAEQPIP